MAQGSNVFRRLKRLFSTDVIIRNVGGKQLKVADIGGMQSVGNLVNNNRADRFSRLFATTVPGYTYNQGILQQTQRLELFRDYEAMDTDPLISSALDIYSDECLQKDTIIPLLDGRKVTIKELHDNQEKDFWLYGLDDRGMFIPIKAEKVSFNGVKKLYKITLEDGTELKSTANHIWLNSDRIQTRTDELKVGDGIYTLPTKLSTHKHCSGYLMIKNDGKWDFIHRIIARIYQKLIEQKTDQSRYIHHSSFDKLNNSPDQLCWLSRDEHLKVHAEYNKQIWTDPNNAIQYKDKIKAAHKKYWTQDKKNAVSMRQSSWMLQHVQSLSPEERTLFFGRKGEKNGMLGKGYKLIGNKNGRWYDDYDRLENIDIQSYIDIILSIHSPNTNIFKEVSKHYKLTYMEYIRINKHICNLYGARTLKQFVDCYNRSLSQVSNHKIISIEECGYDEVFDIINAGTNHIFAVETKDGGKCYTHNCTTKSEFGETLIIQTQNEKIKEVLHNLFYDILNIEFNLWPWTRNLCKYGDTYLHLHLTDKLGVTGVDPFSVYEMIREEIPDPDNPSLLKVQFKRDTSPAGAGRQGDIIAVDGEIYENFEMAHFRLLTDTNFLPYGRAMIEPSRKVWKQLMLMEDAMLLYRIMRAPEKRIFKIDIGNIPPPEVDAYMEKIISKIKKTPYIDQSTGDYNLKFNVQNMLEDFYLPVRGDKSGSSIESLAGLNYDAIQDIDYLKAKLLASLKIPKAYFGYEEDTNGKSSLASQDFRFARTIERIQRIILSELTKIAIIHLYLQGFQDEEIVDFKLQLTAASSIFEQEKIDLLGKKVDLANSILESALFSKQWVYEKIFYMHEDEYLKLRDQVVQDKKDTFRYTQIEEEGNDPVKTGQSFGTPHDIASLYKGKGEVPLGYDEREEPPIGGWPGGGRPKDNGRYGKHGSVSGYDPLGAKANKRIATENVYALDELKRIIALKKSAVQTLFEETEKQSECQLLDERCLIS